MAKSTLFSFFILAMVVTILLCSSTARAALVQDEKDCADQLQNLAECIPYVSGTATKPTTQCCADSEKVRSSRPKCLCVLIMESMDPSLALPINTTLALQMPAACNSDAKVSDCPTILKLSPDSPDAKIFKDPNGDSSKTATPASASPAAASTSGSTGSPPGSADGSSSKVAPSSSTGRLQSFMGVGVVVLAVSVAVITHVSFLVTVHW